MPTTEPSKQVDARVSLSLSHNADGSHWHMRVEDHASGKMILELEMAPEAFGLALGASSGQKACGRVWETYEVLGLIAETKRVKVPELGDRWDDWGVLVAPYEIDGWEADDYDRRSFGGRPNMHRRSQDGSYEVIFRRLVHPPVTSL